MFIIDVYRLELAIFVILSTVVVEYVTVLSLSAVPYITLYLPNKFYTCNNETASLFPVPDAKLVIF